MAKDRTYLAVLVVFRLTVLLEVQEIEHGDGAIVVSDHIVHEIEQIGR